MPARVTISLGGNGTGVGVAAGVGDGWPSGIEPSPGGWAGAAAGVLAAAATAEVALVVLPPSSLPKSGSYP